MRILVVNVNTTEAMTEAIGERARRYAAPSTEIVPLTPFFGPESCGGNLDSYLAAVAVIDRVLAYPEPFDAVIQAGFGEHGREGLQEVLDVPVVDITDAAAHLACLLGRRYSVLTTVERTISLIEDRLLLAGVGRHCISVRATGLDVLELAADRDLTLEVLIRHAAEALERDGADVICFGCAGMADLAEEVQAAVSAPVVDGISAAVKLAEALHALRLSTSKAGSYAPPAAKAMRGWPLHTAMSR
jgi:allantoin racemase